MPGIQMAELQRQMDQLLLAFTRPTAFHQQLTELFERHGLPMHRGAVDVVEPAYHIPMLLEKEITELLRQPVDENPEAALRLIEELWQDRYFEIRMLAASLLGSLPPAAAPMLFDRLALMAKGETDGLMLRLLFRNATQRLRREQADGWLGRMGEWLSASDLATQKIGLEALYSVIEDESFENLPPVYRILEPYLFEPRREHDIRLRGVMKALAQRSPVETAYYLYELAPFITSERGQRFVRSCLPLFDETHQSLIREGLNVQKRTENHVS